MATLKKKLSTLLPEQLPDFIKADHPGFGEFLKTYYEFMESAELKLTNLGSKDSILLEEGTTTYILQEAENRYRKDIINRSLLEDSANGAFVNGETVVGQTSQASAVIRSEDITVGSRLFVSSQNKFLIDEQIVGQTSNASGYIESYTANPVENVSQLMEYADVDNTIDVFFDQFKERFMKTIPVKLAVGVDEKNILKNIKDLYRAKGTRKGHEIFFRLLLDENVELFYPTENMLRVSDGKWSDDSLLRVVQINDVMLLENDENDNIFLVTEDGAHLEQEQSVLLEYDVNKLIGETVIQDAVRDIDILEGGPYELLGYSTIGKATAVVETIIQIQLGSVILYDLVLQEGSITGTFVPGQLVYGEDNTNSERLIKVKNTSLLSAVSIPTSGQYFTTTDLLDISADNGIGAALTIDTVSQGKISNIDIDTVGAGYEIGDNFVVDNSSVTGAGLAGEIAVVGGGFSPETGSLINEFRITLENEVGELLDETSADGSASGISLESGTSGQPGEIITEDGFYIHQEEASDSSLIYFTQEENYGMVATDHIEVEDANIFFDSKSGAKFIQESGTNTGDITDIRVTSIGNNYASLPTLTLPTTSTIRIRAAQFRLEDGTTSAITFGDSIISEIEEDIIILESVGPDAFETTQQSGTFTVGETISPVTQPASTITGTVVKHYTDLSVPNHSFVEFTTGVGTISAGDTIKGAISGVIGDVITKNVRSGGKVIAKGDGDVGKIKSVRVLEPGIHYTEEPTLSTVTNLVLSPVSGTFAINRTITGTGVSATSKSWDEDTQLLKVTSVTGTFTVGQVITQSYSGASGTVAYIEDATFSSDIAATGVFGKYINEDGWLSEDSKRIQDSWYYQDFSYVVKTATSINQWRDELLNTVHPAGFALFGQINPVSIPPLNLRIKTASTTPGAVEARDTITPPLFSAFRTIFTTKLGRRLGTEAQTANASPESGVSRNTALSNDKDVSLTLRIVLDRALAGRGLTTTGYFGDGGVTLDNAENFKFSESWVSSIASSSTFNSHDGYYEKRELTTLNEGGVLSNSDTTITLTSASSFPPSGTIVIENEQITYTGKSTNDLTGCTRGANSTTAATHADGTNVHNYKFVHTQIYGYRIMDWSNVVIDDVTNYPGRKWYIPAPSEITITDT